MQYHVFKNYGYSNESCYIETPSKADAIENFNFACEMSESGDTIELAYFAESGEFICIERVDVV